MSKWILLTIALVVAVWVYHEESKPECVLKFAHSGTETIPFVECSNGEIKPAIIGD